LQVVNGAMAVRRPEVDGALLQRHTSPKLQARWDERLAAVEPLR
jgi:hypothetical protein